MYKFGLVGEFVMTQHFQCYKMITITDNNLSHFVNYISFQFICKPQITLMSRKLKNVQIFPP